MVAMPLYRLMIFHPDRTDYSTTLAGPFQQLKSVLKVDVRQIWVKTPNGQKLHGYYFQKPDAERLFLVCSGNGGNIAHRSVLAANLLICNGSVLLFDYEGYGQSEGTPSCTGIVHDGLSAYDYAVNELAIAPEKIIVYGESLGCAVASQVSKRRMVAAVILQSAFTSLIEAGRERLPWLRTYPDSWFANDNLDNVSVFKQPHAPLLLIHGSNDPILNKENSEQIYAQAVEPKKLVIIKDLGHAVCDVECKEFRAAINSFLVAHSAATSAK